MADEIIKQQIDAILYHVKRNDTEQVVAACIAFGQLIQTLYPNTSLENIQKQLKLFHYQPADLPSLTMIAALSEASLSVANDVTPFLTDDSAASVQLNALRPGITLFCTLIGNQHFANALTNERSYADAEIAIYNSLILPKGDDAIEVRDEAIQKAEKRVSQEKEAVRFLEVIQKDCKDLKYLAVPENASPKLVESIEDLNRHILLLHNSINEQTRPLTKLDNIKHLLERIHKVQAGMQAEVTDKQTARILTKMSHVFSKTPQEVLEKVDKSLKEANKQGIVDYRPGRR